MKMRVRLGREKFRNHVALMTALENPDGTWGHGGALLITRKAIKASPFADLDEGEVRLVEIVAVK